MSIQPNNAPRRSLPVLACIKHTLNSVLNYRAAAVRIALPWIVIITAINFAIALATGGFQASNDPLQLTPGSTLREILLLAVSLLGGSSIAINWHLYILRDQVPESMAGILRLDGPVWRYASYTLLSFAVLLLPVLVLMAIDKTLLPAIAALFLGVIVLRLSLALPAIALGRSDFGFRDALAATQGQMLPLFALLFVNFALVLAVVLVFVLALALATALPVPLNFILASAVALTLNLAGAIYSVSLLSSLYGYYVEHRDF